MDKATPRARAIIRGLTDDSMNTKRIFLWLILLAILILLRPTSTWREAQRIWRQRNWILAVSVTLIAVYVFYGLLSLYRQGGIPGW